MIRALCQQLVTGFVGAGLMCMPLLVSAQGGSITYRPFKPAPVPTMSTWVLIVLAGVLAAVAFTMLRKQGGRHLAIGFIVASAGLLVTGGINVVDRAEADIATYQLTDPSGGAISIGDCSSLVENATTVAQQLVEIVCPPINGGTSAPQTDPIEPCVEGLVLGASEQCMLTARPS